MDGFHYYKKQLDCLPDPVKAHRYRGAYWTFDAQLFVDNVKTLRENETAFFPSFDHSVGDPIENSIHIEKSHRVVIVEGLYTLLFTEPIWKELQKYFHQFWFIDIDKETCYKRVVERHIKTLGLSRPDAEFRARDNDEQNGDIVRTTKQFANIILT